MTKFSVVSISLVRVGWLWAVHFPPSIIKIRSTSMLGSSTFWTWLANKTTSPVLLLERNRPVTQRQSPMSNPITLARKPFSAMLDSLPRPLLPALACSRTAALSTSVSRERLAAWTTVKVPVPSSILYTWRLYPLSASSVRLSSTSPLKRKDKSVLPDYFNRSRLRFCVFTYFDFSRPFFSLRENSQHQVRK